MPSTLECCEKIYGTRDVYAIFEVAKNADEKDFKKAYYTLSLKVHPDRVKENEKEDATEKFKVLSKIYTILSDKDKRALYDEQGVIDDDDDSSGANWMAMWQQVFKPISTQEISNFEKQYIGSEMERNDIKKAYLAGKGCINHMANYVQFMSCEDEPRVFRIVKEMIASEEVPEYKIFTEEPKTKRDRRHKKYEKEAKEVTALMEQRTKKKNQREGSVELQIALRQVERERGFTSLLDRLVDKHGQDEEEENEAFDIDQSAAKKTTKNKSENRGTPQKQGTKGKERKVFKGRVSKKTA